METFVSNFNKIDKKECELQIPHAAVNMHSIHAQTGALFSFGCL